MEEGLKYQQIGIPPEEAQFLETRKFQIDEIYEQVAHERLPEYEGSHLRVRLVMEKVI